MKYSFLLLPPGLEDALQQRGMKELWFRYGKYCNDSKWKTAGSMAPSG
jgi:hypothetical protein